MRLLFHAWRLFYTDLFWISPSFGALGGLYLCAVVIYFISLGPLRHSDILENRGPLKPFMFGVVGMVKYMDVV